MYIKTFFQLGLNRTVTHKMFEIDKTGIYDDVFHGAVHPNIIGSN